MDGGGHSALPPTRCGRYLVDRLATQIWELHDQKMIVYKGTYRQYMLQRFTRNSQLASRSAILLNKPIFKVDGREARKKAELLELLEDRIHQQEKTIIHLSQELQKAGRTQSFENMNQISHEVAKAQAALDHLMVEWEQTVS